MNVTNSSQALNSSKTPWCPRSIIDDEYIAVDYFFAVLSVVLNVLTCPLIILLNTLIIIAIKTKPRLQTMHNLLLACLAGTDLVVGLVQPIFIAKDILLMDGRRTSVYCTFYQIIQTFTIYICIVSLFHLALIGLERYVVMKFSLRYESIVTQNRITVAVVLSWLICMITSVGRMPGIRMVPNVLFVIFVIISLLVIFFCHISVYLVSRRHMIQIQAEQVSTEAKRKFLSERKALKITTIILFGVFLSYLPSIVTGLIMQGFPGSLANRISISSVPLTASCFLFNSLYNPIIYCWRNKEMRQAIKQLLKMQEN